MIGLNETQESKQDRTAMGDSSTKSDEIWRNKFNVMYRKWIHSTNL